MSEKTAVKERAWELDFLRGIALILMLFMHFSWDVRYEFGVNVFSYLEKGWFWSFGHPVIVVLFVGVSGICCTFSRSNIKRGLKLLAAALTLTLVTCRTLKMIRQSMPANFVMRYVTRVSVNAAARSFNPLLILLRENVHWRMFHVHLRRRCVLLHLNQMS